MTLDEAKKVLNDCPPDMHCCDACFLDERCQAETLLMMHVEDLERQNEELQKDAICALVRVPRWISVEERLPDESEGLVLIVASGGHKNICFDNALLLGSYYDDSGWIVEGYVDWEDARVTHWMPLPEPPEEGEA